MSVRESIIQKAKDKIRNAIIKQEEAGGLNAAYSPRNIVNEYIKNTLIGGAIGGLMVAGATTLDNHENIHHVENDNLNNSTIESNNGDYSDHNTINNVESEPSGITRSDRITAGVILGSSAGGLIGITAAPALSYGLKKLSDKILKTGDKKSELKKG